jgi:ferredoxin-NADP reductase
MMISTEKLTRQLRLSKKIQETADTFSLVFQIPPELKETFKYDAGQFVTLFLNLNGDDIRRSYSLASSPDCDPDFKISVKRVKGGKVSNYLIDSVKEGDVFNVTPPAGLFVLPKALDGRELVFFAAGSGITPIISLIKSALKRSASTKVHLLYCNRDEESVIFFRELKSLNAEFHERFSYDLALSQPKKAFDGFSGRLQATQVKTFLSNHKIPKTALHYVCGPEGFMATIEASLELEGYPKSALIKESFASPAPSTAKEYKPDAADDAVYIGDPSIAFGETKEIEAVLNGETIKVPYLKGSTVLESLLEAGHNPPYSCMDGACMACMGKIQSGRVYQNDMGILTEDHVEAKECLTCQARPCSAKVKINYDSF